MIRKPAVLIAAPLITLGIGVAWAQEPPFGSEEDVAYAETLWQALSEARLVGENAFVSKPYEGTEPHRAILITQEGDVTVEGHTGLGIAKYNYLDTTVDEVWNNPDQNLDSITVMYQRADGYDPETNNWFWAKYNPDGSLQANPQGRPLAGLVGKGAEQGCIPCHQAAEGDDFVYNHDRLAE